MTVLRTIELADITPAELAELFCEMDGIQQAAFFAEVKPITDKWPGAGWCQQSCGIADMLDDAGREVISKLAEHVLGYDELLATVRKCRDQFDFYVAAHTAKTPPDMDKAATNQEFVELCDAVLNPEQAR